MPSKSNVTTDHEEIPRWVEERGGKPACVRGTGGAGDVGMLRIDFPGYSGGESLEHIGWDEFFRKFDDNKLAFLYQNKQARGGRSNFNKLIARGTAQMSARGRRGSASRGGSRASSAQPVRGGSRKRASSRSVRAASAGSRRRVSAQGRRPASRDSSSSRRPGVGKRGAKRSAARSSHRRAA